MIHLFLDPRYWFMSPVERKRRQIDARFIAGDIDAYTAEVEKMSIAGEPNQRDLISARLRHGRMTQYEHDIELCKLEHAEGIEREIALAEVERRHEKITQKQFDKTVATLKKEPWIGIIDDGYDVNQGVNGLFFELDWNDYWIDYLRLNGYGGKDQDQIVEQWFSDVCRSQIGDEGDEDNVIPVEMITEKLATLKTRN